MDSDFQKPVKVNNLRDVGDVAQKAFFDFLSALAYNEEKPESSGDRFFFHGPYGYALSIRKTNLKGDEQSD